MARRREGPLGHRVTLPPLTGEETAARGGKRVLLLAVREAEEAIPGSLDG